MTQKPAPADLPPEVFRAGGTIDVKRLIASFDEAGHAERAERYFRRPNMVAFGLHKPWLPREAVDGVLSRLAAVMQLLRPFPDARILDFGCGVGWLSRVMARLGMRVAAADVSGTALQIGEAYTLGHEPDIARRITWHLLEEGRIPLPDGALDRIVSFDAFHHVPDQARVLAEMARVLAPGGRVVFSEPGDRHSESDEAQAEMRNFGVIENNVDIAEVARIAALHGLEPGEVALTSHPVPTIPFAAFQDEVARVRRGEPPAPHLVARVFRPLDVYIDTVRVFSLLKPEPDTAPDPDGITPAGPDGQGAAGRLVLRNAMRGPNGIEIELAIENLGPFRWVPRFGDTGFVNVGVMLRSQDGTLLRDWRRLRVPAAAVRPGGRAVLKAALPLPDEASAFVFDLVAEHTCWFGVEVEARLDQLPG